MLALLQNGLRPREPRTKVLVPCRLNIAGAWADACIHNVSSRGMLVATDAAAPPGSYVEIRRGTLVLIGRVVWREGRFFGVRTQDRISVEALVGEPRRTTAPPRPGQNSADERRSDRRLVVEGRRARQVERNRHHSAAMQFAVLLLGGAAAAILAGYEVYGVLGQSLGVVSGALGGAPH
jgi:hypothetical protein